MFFIGLRTPLLVERSQTAFLHCNPYPSLPTEGSFMTTSQAIFPANRHALYEKHGYSAAIRSGSLLFVSGQVGSRDDGSPEPDFEAQVERAFANLTAVLAAAGCGLSDIVDVTTFHTDPENQFEAIMKVRGQHFPAAPYAHGP